VVILVDILWQKLTDGGHVLAIRVALATVISVAACWFWWTGPADAQTKKLFGDQHIEVRCFQNGVEILEFEAIRIVPQIRDDLYIEYTTTDGRKGQLRFAFNTMCTMEAIKQPSPSS